MLAASTAGTHHPRSGEALARRATAVRRPSTNRDGQHRDAAGQERHRECGSVPEAADLHQPWAVQHERAGDGERDGELEREAVLPLRPDPEHRERQQTLGGEIG